MMHTRLLGVLLGAALACCGTTPARSEPQRIALVISNAQYKTLPPLPVCSISTEIVRDALRGKGIEVIERADLGRGEFDTTIGNLARRAAASPAALVTLYYCGYALEFTGRSFLLPISANLAREYDVLTQGIISKSLLDSLDRVKGSGGVVVLDVFRAPNAAASGLARLADQAVPTYGIIGVSNEIMPAGPTPASLALRDRVSELDPNLEKFVNGIRDRLASNGAVTTHIALPTRRPLTLPSAPAPPAPAASASPSIAPPPPSPPPDPSFAAPPAPRQIMADDEQMTEQDRRQVQVKLATLGYYIGRIDANFGPETRAAIRRYQFEIKAEMTGRLTAEQATRLVNSVR